MPLKKNIVLSLVLLLLALFAGGWYLWRERQPDHAAERKTSPGQQIYTCSMHPFIIRDRPGTCPICGMELIRKVDAAPNGTSSGTGGESRSDLPNVILTDRQRVMANVETVEARQQLLTREINAVGIVQYDQARQAKVTAWIAGRIDRLLVNSVGSFVSRSRPVAEVYSPDLVSTQQEYLLALKSREQLKNSPIPAISQNGDGLVASARQRLMLFGVKESQIAALEKAGKPNIRLPIYTPLSGIVIEKLVQQGQYVNVGDVLFNIADLSRVWIELDIYEADLALVRVGQRVEIGGPSIPGRTLSGMISFVNPFLDPKTRTIKVRVEMPNPGMKLKPDMFVNAIIKVPLGSSIVVPVTAVMDSGKRRLVWVERSPGMFEPHDVQVGQQNSDRIQILSGLKEGDKVAVSGGYLIDSEAQLKGGTGQDHSEHSGGKPAAKGQSPAADQKPPGGHEGGGATPAHPRTNDPLNMDDMKM